MTTEDIIKDVIEDIRPDIQMDGGDLEFVSYDEKEKIVNIALKGACVGCPMSSITLKQGIEYMMRERLPEIKEVRDVGANAEMFDEEY